MLGFPDCEEERACCLAFMNVLLLSRGCQWSVSLSRGVMGWSVEWDCDISLYTQLLVTIHKRYKSNLLFEPVHEISNNVVSATNKASDQPAHTRSLIRAFASRLSIL